MLSDLEQQSRLSLGHFQGVQDRRQVAFELHVDDGTDDGHDLAVLARCGFRLCGRIAFLCVISVEGDQKKEPAISG